MNIDEKFNRLNDLYFKSLFTNSSSKEDTCHNVYHICNDVTHDRLLNDLEMHFIELPKFTFSDIKRLRRSEKWIALFSNKCNAKQLEEIAMSEPSIKEVLKYEEYFRNNPELRRQYDLQEKAERDRRSEINYVKFKTAANYIKSGIDYETVAKCSDMTIDEVKQAVKMFGND